MWVTVSVVVPTAILLLTNVATTRLPCETEASAPPLLSTLGADKVHSGSLDVSALFWWVTVTLTGPATVLALTDVAMLTGGAGRSAATISLLTSPLLLFWRFTLPL